MFYNFLTVAIRNAIRHKFYAFISLSSLAIGLTCAVLIMLSIRYDMSYDAFRPHADRVYRIMKRDIDARGQVVWRGALPSEIAVHLRDEYPEVEAVVQFRRITSWFSHGKTACFNSAFVRLMEMLWISLVSILFEGMLLCSNAEMRPLF